MRSNLAMSCSSWAEMSRVSMATVMCPFLPFPIALVNIYSGRQAAVPPSGGAVVTRYFANDRPARVGRGEGRSALAQQFGDPEGEVQRLAAVEPGVAGRGIAQFEVVLNDLLSAAQALGHAVAGELDVDATGPGARLPAGSEEAGDLL